MKIKIVVILLLFATYVGCIEEALDKCSQGNVRVKVYAEKFQTNSEDASLDCEDIFNKRVQFLHCMLYRGDTFVKDTVVADVSALPGAFWEFNIRNLEFGKYNLVVVGNCSPAAMSGDFHRRGGLSLLYTMEDKTADLFGGVLDFTVDCDCTTEHAIKLRRLLGVIRCQIKSIPEAVSETEIVIHGVNSSIGKGGVYSKHIDVNKRMRVESLVRASSGRDQNIVLGVFPTLADEFASFQLKFYTDSSPIAVFDKVMSKEVKVERNQLVELIADFSDGTVNFEIKIDGKWEDYINGGEVEIQ